MEELPQDKACHRCGIPQPLDNFYRDKAAPDGRRKTCIVCDKARKRTTEVREQSRRYNNSPKGKEAGRRYYYEGHGREVRKAYAERPDRREPKLESARRAGRKYWRTTKGRVRYETYISQPVVADQRRARSRTYYWNDPDGNRAYHRKWNREHYRRKPSTPGRRLRQRLYEHERRAKARQLESSLTGGQWIACLEYFDSRCLYCGSQERIQQDHFLPLSRGGGYSARNIVPACISCNSAKGNREPHQWCSAESISRALEYFTSL